MLLLLAAVIPTAVGCCKTVVAALVFVLYIHFGDWGGDSALSVLGMCIRKSYAGLLVCMLAPVFPFPSPLPSPSSDPSWSCCRV
jgi:hypothetical protein